MSRPETFERSIHDIEATFIAITKDFAGRQMTKHTTPASSMRLFLRLLAAVVALVGIERRLYRVMAAYRDLLLQFPPADPAEAQKRMETLSFVIRSIQEMVIEFGVEAENSIERVYLSRVNTALDALVSIWNGYADLTNDDLVVRIKDASVHYLA